MVGTLTVGKEEIKRLIELVRERARLYDQSKQEYKDMELTITHGKVSRKPRTGQTRMASYIFFQMRFELIEREEKSRGKHLICRYHFPVAKYTKATIGLCLRTAHADRVCRLQETWFKAPVLSDSNMVHSIIYHG